MAPLNILTSAVLGDPILSNNISSPALFPRVPQWDFEVNTEHTRMLGAFIYGISKIVMGILKDKYGSKPKPHPKSVEVVFSARSTFEVLNDAAATHGPQAGTSIANPSPNPLLAPGVAGVAVPIIIVLLALLVFLRYRNRRGARLELERSGKKGCCECREVIYSDDGAEKQKLCLDIAEVGS